VAVPVPANSPTPIEYKIASLVRSGSDAQVTAQTAPESTNYIQITYDLNKYQNASGPIIATNGTNAVSISATIPGFFTNEQAFIRCLTTNAPVAQYPPK
jgi:hypothetical protein